MSTRSLRHPTDTLSATIPKIELLFSIPKLYLLVLCMSANGPFTLLPKERPGCHSPCHSSTFLMSKQPPSLVSLKYYYTNICPLLFSTVIITNLIKISSLLQNAAANCSQDLHATLDITLPPQFQFSQIYMLSPDPRRSLCSSGFPEAPFPPQCHKLSAKPTSLG